ncbi:hypothetical protein ACFWZ2_07970 [Streptomyces sp. NPDC059002]|uniref:hypothetical protein n=1 Tax=Streptomyces sp. NPDC059002 TaxID=3346690 RepID=UPI0036AECCD3
MVRRWYAALGFNVLLGIPAVIPLWMLWYIAATWAHPAPEENDGLGVVVALFGPLVAACGFLWWAANRPLARRTHLSQSQYWLLSLLGMCLPTVALFCNTV